MAFNGPKMDKSVTIMNKCVMDWRWKAIVAKTDPAQLKTSVLDWLLPRLELGLLHAGVTEKMCNAWLSAILHTLAHLSSKVNQSERLLPDGSSRFLAST